MPKTPEPESCWRRTRKLAPPTPMRVAMELEGGLMENRPPRGALLDPQMGGRPARVSRRTLF